MYSTPELLAPAGSVIAAKAAIAAGCNAIYMGTPNFGARNIKEPITEAELEELIDYCHVRGVHIYFTVNTIYQNEELPALFLFMKKLYAFGADAFILQDIGVATYVHKQLPSMPLFASTQMTANSLADVEFLASCGFCRVILGRELSLSDISFIAQNTKTQLEVFVHGALCVCYSGQCLMSSMIGKRSGNKGRCAQPCRKTYELQKNGQTISSGYLLSQKDLMTLPNLKELCATSIASIKIEGRLKSPEYVFQVTQAYRQQLNKIAQNEPNANSVDEQTLQNVTQVFNRGGFTKGYLTQHSHISMMSPKNQKSVGRYVGKVMGYDAKHGVCKIFLEETVTPGDGIEIWTKKQPHVGTNISTSGLAGDIVSVDVYGAISTGDLVYKSFDKQLMDTLKASFSRDTAKISVLGQVVAKKNQPICLRLSYQGLLVEKTGEVVQEAKNAAMTEEKIIEKLSKTGSTSFLIHFANNQIDENVFLGIASLNELRRAATEELAQKIKLSYKREPKFLLPSMPKAKNETNEQALTALVQTEEQLLAVLQQPGFARVYVETRPWFLNHIETLAQLCKQKGVALFAALPLVSDTQTQSLLDTLEKSSIDGFLVRNYGNLLQLEHTQKIVATDHTFNVSNSLSFAFLSELVKGNVCLSPEIGFSRFPATGGKLAEVQIYGNLPLMVTRQCPIGLYTSEKLSGKWCQQKNKSNGFALKDGTGAIFPIVTDCEACLAYVLNGKPMFMLHKMKDLRAANVGFLRLVFTTETAQETKDLSCAFMAAFLGKHTDLMQTLTDKVQETGFTYGYFYTSH